MANKKLLVCVAIAATALLLNACVKKEEPKEDQNQQTSSSEAPTNQSTVVDPSTTEPQPQEQIDQPVAASSVNTEVLSQDTTDNTEATKAAVQAQPKEIQPTKPVIEKPQVEQPRTTTPKPEKTAQPAQVTNSEPVTKPKDVAHQASSNTTSQSVDDAVAEAMAAAAPALKN